MNEILSIMVLAVMVVYMVEQAYLNKLKAKRDELLIQVINKHSDHLRVNSLQLDKLIIAMENLSFNTESLNERVRDKL